MATYVCSLIRDTPQLIPADGGYHIIRFPFGSSESYDAHTMHQVAQPDGYTIGAWDSDDRSGLIWPRVAGWATLTANIHWEAGGYSELRDRFVRDPLDLTTGADSTATDHRPPSPGMQCFTKHHEIFVHPGTPVAFLAGHNDSVARKVVHAQFKLAVESDVAQ
ncbi:hypothetical protein [Nocardiopsis sp. NPDC057823]|uniref:hypothetical protein n=1 Tax=Nocardiopsis sp. NPDC057823 TaxID=3346256 RepID=UPI00366B8370